MQFSVYYNNKSMQSCIYYFDHTRCIRFGGGGGDRYYPKNIAEFMLVTNG